MDQEIIGMVPLMFTLSQLEFADNLFHLSLIKLMFHIERLWFIAVSHNAEILRLEKTDRWFSKLIYKQQQSVSLVADIERIM